MRTMSSTVDWSRKGRGETIKAKRRNGFASSLCHLIYGNYDLIFKRFMKCAFGGP